MTTACLSVLTARGFDRLLEEGGSQAWRLKPENAEKLAYCVCVQNQNNGHWGAADQPHHHAFMVGRIKSIVPSPEGRPGRYLVVFSEYARIDVANAWPGLRNPIRYATLEDFGITDPEALDWQPMPQPKAGGQGAHSEDEEKDGFGPLTIAEAKAGLALGLGVPESAIEISVKF
ncbi:hypothetical protein [Sphingobium sp. CECT 9361]|uniref:hypothetical protein n=1 Tax=Sphingobium sp. CECT 9361 TaxID=2845384 RepID=UPI001E60C069|nr:hypothetical protein [Sphingobium sp. CECT 9361]CAH0357272.1 hypothetical protein SPH9361_04921 [Sphingobium sp. CECT 9361]